MNAAEAQLVDRSFYADQDGDLWYVFGSETGFAYTEHTSKFDAETAALRKNRDRT